MNKKVIIYTDGGARGNPGPAGIGVVIFDSEEKNIIGQYKKYIGETTNNQAEYKAVVLGLEEAKKLKAQEVEVRMDSELVCSQINGVYKLKNKDFQDSFIKIWNLKQSFKKTKFKYIPREKNKLADKLVNQAIDKK
ncbi:MAG: ribonuclease HI family protein [Patescibacteria group bacterium]